MGGLFMHFGFLEVFFFLLFVLKTKPAFMSATSLALSQNNNAAYQTVPDGNKTEVLMTKTPPNCHPLGGTLRGRVQPLGDKVETGAADEEFSMQAGKIVK